jgi:hypothetical protein
VQPAPAVPAFGAIPGFDADQAFGPDPAFDAPAPLSALMAEIGRETPVPLPVEPAEPLRPASGPASMDILPSRGGRRFGRRKAAAAPPQQPVARPMAPVALPEPRQTPNVPQPQLLTRATQAPVLPVPSAPIGRPSAFTGSGATSSETVMEPESRRSLLASEALTELSRLSAYSPAAVNTAGPGTLTRRTAGSTPAAAKHVDGSGSGLVPAPRAGAASDSDGPVRERSAAGVRNMLVGFTSGVERGRMSPAARKSVLHDGAARPDTSTEESASSPSSTAPTA